MNTARTRLGAGHCGINHSGCQCEFKGFFYSLSGQAEGWAWANAGRVMQASKAAMVRGKPVKFTSKRWALKICGTRQQSASVGVWP